MISELKVIRYSIDKYIVKKFIDQLKKTINLDISEKLVDEVTLIVIDQKNKGEFLLKLIHNGLWKCSCKY